jgi:isoquinoline 1-oxidoreductase beta subunit
MYWKSLREAGAAAFNMLMQAVVQNRSVPIKEITAKSGTYGAFASKASAIAISKGVKLKDVRSLNTVRTAIPYFTAFKFFDVNGI